MYEKNGWVFAEPYTLLKHKSTGTVSFQKTGTRADFYEIEAPADDLKIENGIAKWGNGFCIQAIKPGADFGYYKQRLIKRRYSVDEQLAIAFNENEVETERMQLWRQWASDIAHRIINLLQK